MSERPTSERLAKARCTIDRLLPHSMDHTLSPEQLTALEHAESVVALAAELLAVTERERALAEALRAYVERHEFYGRHFLDTGEYTTMEMLRDARAALAAAHGDTPEPALPPCDCRANDWVEGDNGAVRCVQCGGYAGEPGTSIRVVGAAEATEETT